MAQRSPDLPPKKKAEQVAAAATPARGELIQFSSLIGAGWVACAWALGLEMRTIAAPAIASILLLLSLFAFTQRPSIKFRHILDLPVASNGALVSFRFSGLAHLTILRDGTLIYNGSEISRELLREELSEWCSTRAEDYPSLRISLHPDTPMHHLRSTYESIDDIGLSSLYFTVYIVSRGA